MTRASFVHVNRRYQYPGSMTCHGEVVYPGIIIPGLNKDKELEGGNQNLCSCFACLGGALKMLLVLRGGQRKNIITVEFLLSLPLYNK
jgi:hypothetical protein